MPILTCANCKTQFRRTPSEIATPALYRFCSRKCQNAHQGRRHGQKRHERALAERKVERQPKSYKLIALKGGTLTKVSNEDYEVASKVSWHLHTGGYVSNKPHYLHRIVLERMLGRKLGKGDVVDHINHDKLDNRRHNLRLANVALNGGNMKLPAHNTSGYKGAQYKPKACKSRPWLAEIKIEQVPRFIGFFATAEEAAYAYDQWALQLFGEFAHTNFELS